ncbi:LysR substrate-binding domain-containing protein [Kiloniella majae]|uniref:LysR substrate-binding domain-containing protein n=1 Tax=Kiloniella majae TaxID=1938558 RepID=UPI000A276D92|nr:LysR substrate-binding domain-containing protein [Kiloniella majae]
MNRSSLPPLNAIRAFEVTARKGRMVDAAQELNVTYGAISKQIRHLEDVMGVRLFEGPRNKLQLTEAGVKLQPQLTAIFDQLEASISSVVDSEEGVLDVACIGTFMMRWLLPRLHRFSAHYPKIEVRLSTTSVTPNLANAACDLAIVVGENNWPSNVDATPLFAELVGPVMTPELDARFSVFETGSLTEREEVPLLHSLTRKSAWQDWSKATDISVPDTDKGTELEHIYFMLEAAMGGLGAAIAPWALVSEDIRAGRLVAPFGFVPNGQVYTVISRDAQRKKNRAFLSWIKSEAMSSPLWSDLGDVKP